MAKKTAKKKAPKRSSKGLTKTTKKKTAKAAPKKKATKKTSTKKKVTKTSSKSSSKSTAKKSTKKSAAKKSSRSAKARASEPKAEVIGEEEIPVERRESASSDRRQDDRRQTVMEVDNDRRQSERRSKVARRRQIDPTTCERDYSNDEIEFMHALDEYKRRAGRMFPTCSEILEVVRELGYRRLTPEELALLSSNENPEEAEGTAEPTDTNSVSDDSNEGDSTPTPLPALNSPIESSTLSPPAADAAPVFPASVRSEQPSGIGNASFAPSAFGDYDF